MFPLGMGMAGAAAATAVSQYGAAAMYGWRLWKRRLLPQRNDKNTVNRLKVVKSILRANLRLSSSIPVPTHGWISMSPKCKITCASILIVNFVYSHVFYSCVLTTIYVRTSTLSRRVWCTANYLYTTAYY